MQILEGRVHKSIAHVLKNKKKVSFGLLEFVIL